MPYAEYLRSPEWRAIKAKARKRPNFRKCYVCGSTERIDLHHMSYNTVGTTDLRNIRVLCRAHHEEVHAYARATGKSVRLATRSIRKQFRTNASIL